jgi:hypothetical protein
MNWSPRVRLPGRPQSLVSAPCSILAIVLLFVRSSGNANEHGSDAGTGETSPNILGNVSHRIWVSLDQRALWWRSEDRKWPASSYAKTFTGMK